MKISSSLIIFALNEINGLKHIKHELDKYTPCVDEVIFVDGGSKDGTIEFAQRQNDWRVIIQNENNKGPINALKLGIENSNSTHVILFTPDNNCIASKIKEIVKKFKQGYDYVKVSRYLDGAKSYDDTLISGFGNWMFTKIIQLIYKSKCTDALNIYYGFRKNLLKELKINLGPGLNSEFTIKNVIFDVNYIDIKGDEPCRVGGEVSRSIIIAGFNELKSIIKFIPLLFKK
jgi:glycosyltransferase involved in cell wall biosynthesis